MMIIACHNGTFCFTNSAYLRSPPLASYKLLSFTKLMLAPVIHRFNSPTLYEADTSQYAGIAIYEEDFVSHDGDAFYK